jgi:hypothetical protein
MHHREYALQFFMHLSPTYLKRPQDVARFMEIFTRSQKSDNTSFKIVLDNEIELF